MTAPTLAKPPKAFDPGTKRHPGGRSCAVLVPLLALALPVLWVAGLLMADKPDPPEPPPRPQPPEPPDPLAGDSWIHPR